MGPTATDTSPALPRATKTYVTPPPVTRVAEIALTLTEAQAIELKRIVGQAVVTTDGKAIYGALCNVLP